MPIPFEDSFTEELADVKRSFLRSLEPRILRLSELLLGSAGGCGTPEGRAEIQAIAHKLAGSSASFGLHDIGAVSMTLEDKLIDVKTGPVAYFACDVEKLIYLCEIAMI